MKKVLLVLALCCMLTAGAHALTNVTACGTLASSDYYVLQNNLTTTGTCLTVGTNNVTIDCNGHRISYGTSGASSVYGIFADSRANVSVHNCHIEDPHTSGSATRAIYYLDTQTGRIANNFLYANGTSSVYTIFIERTSPGPTSLYIANNTLGLEGSNVDDRVIYLLRSNNNTLVNNTLSGISSGSNLNGILLNIADDNLVDSNSMVLGGTTASSFGLYSITGVNNTWTNNNVTIQGTSTAGTRGILLVIGARDNLVENNTFTVLAGGTTGGGPRGISIDETSDRTIVRNNVVVMNAPNTEHGVLINDAQDNVLINNTVRMESGLPLSLAFRILGNASGTYLANNRLRTSTRWINVASTNTNTTFVNQTFETGFGRIRFDGFSFDGAQDFDTDDLDIGNVSAFVNSTNNTLLNASARISFFNTGFAGHRILVDYNDDGSFEQCLAPDCVEVSDTPGQVVFDVLHFTTFSAEEFIPPVPEFSTIALFAILGLVLGGFVVMRQKIT